MSRISEAFARLQIEGRRGIIPFVAAGDPDLETSGRIVVELARCGATAVELGVPFSDPVADGPTIQSSYERALRRGITASDVLCLVSEIRRETDVPIILFSYFNPLMRLGTEAFCTTARETGVDGVLVTDLVPEESDEFNASLARVGIDQIFLVAPTSTDARLRLAAEKARGFIYAVSRAGVTGARTQLSTEAEQLVRRVRNVSGLPVAVGFGISTAAHVGEVWRYADAAIIGSAIVAEIERLAGSRELVESVGRFVRGLFPTSSEG